MKKTATKSPKKSAKKNSAQTVSRTAPRKSSSKLPAKSVKNRMSLQAENTGVQYRKTVLPNGLRILSEKQLSGRAVSCGIWVTKGTRHELANEAGMGHFVEHMVFKRTKKRSAYQIARDMEAVGGELNAYTSRESTCFVTHSLNADLALSLDVLSDLVCHPVFDPVDIRKEKQVVLQELHMAEDVLEEFIFDKYFELAYKKSALGTPILGTAKSIEAMNRQTITDFHSKHYRPENIVVTVAGQAEHDQVLDLALKYLKFAPASKTALAPDVQPVRVPEVKSFRAAFKKPSEQAHVILGLPSTSFTDPLRFEAYIINTLLGGGMTSRLFQSVREDKGLAYSVYSQLATFVDTGMLLIYAGTEPKKMPTLVETMLKELKKLKRDGVTRADLELFKTQVLGQILLGADDVENRMNSLGANEMVLGKYRSVETVMREIEEVSLDSIHEYIEKFTDLNNAGVLVMGPVPEEPTRRWLEGL